MRLTDTGYVPLTPGGMGGTPVYMAPEQAGHDIDALSPATDVYLLGAILHELCIGRAPHTATDLHECIDNAVANIIDSEINEHPLLYIAYKAMQTHPRDRYANAQEFIVAVQNAQRHIFAHQISQDAIDLVEKSLAGSEVDDALNIAAAQMQQAQELLKNDELIAQRARDVREVQAEHAMQQADYGLVVSLFADEQQHPLVQRALLAQRQSRYWQRQRRLWKNILLYGGIAASVIVILFGLIAQDSSAEARLRMAEIMPQAELAHHAAQRAQQAHQIHQYEFAATACAVSCDLLENGRNDLAREILAIVRTVDRGWTWNYLWRRAQFSSRFIPAQLGDVRHMCLSPDADIMLVANAEKLLAIDLQTGAEIWQREQSGVRQILCHEDGTFYVLGSAVWTLSGYDATASNTKDRFAQVQWQEIFPHQDGGYLHIAAFAQDHGLVVSTGKNIAYWHRGEMQTIKHERKVTMLHIDGEHIIVGFQNNLVCTYNRWDMSLLSQREIGNKRATLRAMSADGQTAMYSFGNDVYSGTTGFWDYESGEHQPVASGIRAHSPAVVSDRVVAGFEPRRKVLSIGARKDKNSPVSYQGYDFMGQRTPAIVLSKTDELYYAFSSGITQKTVRSHHTYQHLNYSIRVREIHIMKDQQLLLAADKGRLSRIFTERDTGYKRIDHYISETGRYRPTLAADIDQSQQRVLGVQYESINVYDILDDQKILEIAPREGSSWRRARFSSRSDDYLWAMEKRGGFVLYNVEKILNPIQDKLIAGPIHKTGIGTKVAFDQSVFMVNREGVHATNFICVDGHILHVWRDGLMRLFKESFERDSFECIMELQVPSSEVRGPLLMPDKDHIFIAGGKNLNVIDVACPGERLVIKFPSIILGLVIIEDGQELMVSLKNGHVQSLRMSDYACLMDLPLT
ncbi:MAG: hypothetical protein HRU15_13835, partial [Planctomycetes bacterium]|nr:hypothetical protein [Planctomycetota bacterium]